MRRRDVAQKIEPEDRELRKDASLIGNAGRQDVIEGGDAIGRDDQEALAGAVDVAHLALGVALDAGKIGFQNDGVLSGFQRHLSI
jgi:hypothetical protein